MTVRVHAGRLFMALMVDLFVLIWTVSIVDNFVQCDRTPAALALVMGKTVTCYILLTCSAEFTSPRVRQW